MFMVLNLIISILLLLIWKLWLIILLAAYPPTSERRIISINKDNHTITWFYDSHEDDDVKDEELKLGKQIITEDIFSFMSKLIIHIPDKNFKIIRYYGFYANRFINKLENNLHLVLNSKNER